MPYLKQVPREEVTDETVLRFYDRIFGEGGDPVKTPGTATGTRGDWWGVFALCPDIFQHAVDGFAVYRHVDRKIDPRHRELGQTRAGWLTGSSFVYSQHCKAMRNLGMGEEKIKAVASWQVSDVFDEQERAILAYTDYLVGERGRVPEPVMEKLKTFWSDQEIMEFTYITALYDMHAVMSRALRLEYDDRPDLVSETAAPPGYDATDFLSGALPPRKTIEGQKN